MPTPSPLQLGTMLQSYMYKNEINQQETALEIGISTPTLCTFLRGKRTPQRKTVEAVEDYLKSKGVLSRLGLPTPDEIDRQAQKEIGFTSVKIKEEVPSYYIASANLTPETFYRLVGKIMEMPDGAREECLQKLLPHEFPSEA